MASLPLTLLLARVSNIYVQDVDPLQDTIPPRYALESDSEDEELYPGAAKRQIKPALQCEFILMWTGAPPGNSLEKRTLVVGIGEPGTVWGKGLQLGDKLGGALLNDEEVCIVYFYVVDAKPTREDRSRRCIDSDKLSLYCSNTSSLSTPCTGLQRRCCAVSSLPRTFSHF